MLILFLFLGFSNSFTKESINLVEDYSNREITNEQLTIYIDDSVTVEGFHDSKFIECTVKDEETHLLVVKKKFIFDTIEFSFINTKIGAIKIESTKKRTRYTYNIPKMIDELHI